MVGDIQFEKALGIIVGLIFYPIPICFRSWFLEKSNKIGLLPDQFLFSSQVDIILEYIIYIYFFLI